ncbi:MAG: hypothetical protein U1E23_18770 [Reyranellaceae bacterium]
MRRRAAARSALALALVALAPARPGGAQPSNPSPVQSLLPSVLPLAENARARVISHPTLAAFEIEAMMRKAVAQAKAALTGPHETGAARALLQPLEAELGAVRILPLVEIQQLLGAIAGIEGRTADQTFHRAFAVSLMLVLDRTGDGKSPRTARQVVLIAEEYDWFAVNPEVQRRSRVSKDIDGRTYDIWTVATAAGEETLYFDATAMGQSTLRVLAAREAAGKRPR